MGSELTGELRHHGADRAVRSGAFLSAERATESANGLGWQAVYWPVSMWTNYVSPEDRRAASGDAWRRLAASEPVCIGKQRYRFRSVKVLVLSGAQVIGPKLECIRSAELSMTADALGVTSLMVGKMTIFVSAPTQRDRERREHERLERERRGRWQGPPSLAIEDGDLVVSLLPPYGAHVPDDRVDFVRDRLRQFIREARLPAAPDR